MQHETIETECAKIARPSFTVSDADVAALADAVKFLAMRVVERRNSIPILSNVRIDADLSGTITLTGTDLDLQASVTLSADVAAPGTFTTNAHNLADMLAKAKKAKAREVRLTSEDDCRAALAYGRNRFALNCLPADDFPMIAHPAVGRYGPMPLSRFSVPGPQFIADMAALAPCISKDERRPHICGVAFQRRTMAGRERLVTVATDGTAMAIASRALPDGAQSLVDAILPDKAVAVIGHAAKLAKDTPTVRINAGDKMTLEIGHVTLTAKLIDADYPLWHKVFETQLAPTSETEPVLFPDLLPGVPLAIMDKLAKKGPGAIDWQPAFQGRLGIVESDPDMLFAVYVDPRNSDAPKGFSYTADNLTFTVEGDATVYPVATKGGRMNLTAAQVREIVGESCFETFAVTLADGETVYVLQWLWDDGCGHFLTVRPNGRCFTGKDAHKARRLSRAEIEAALAGETLPAEPMAETEAAPTVDTDAPMFATMADFKAAMVIGSRWKKSQWRDGAWHHGESVTVRTVAYIRAREVGFAWGDMTPAEAERCGMENRRNLAWLGFPARGHWQSDADGMIILWGDGTPNCRFDPLPPLEPVAEQPAQPATVPAQQQAKPEPAPEGLEPENALSGDCEAISVVTEKPRDIDADPIADACGLLASIDCTFTLPAEPVEMVADTPTGAIERAKRSPAHERAVRRAWALRRRTRELERTMATVCNHARDSDGENMRLKTQIETGIAQLDAMRERAERAERLMQSGLEKARATMEGTIADAQRERDMARQAASEHAQTATAAIARAERAEAIADQLRLDVGEWQHIAESAFADMDRMQGKPDLRLVA